MRDGTTTTTRAAAATTRVGGDDVDVATTNTNTRSSGAGTPDDPVVIHDDEDENENENGAHSRGGGDGTPAVAGGRGSESRSPLSPSLSYTSSCFLALSLMIACPLLLASPALWKMFLEIVVDDVGGDRSGGGEGGDDDTTTSGPAVDAGLKNLVVLAALAHAVMVIAAHRMFRDIFSGSGGGGGGGGGMAGWNGGGIWSYPGNHRGGTSSRRGRGRKLTVSEIADIGASSFFFLISLGFFVVVTISRSRDIEISSLGLLSPLCFIPI